MTATELFQQGPSESELRSACRIARQYGYDCSTFRFSSYERSGRVHRNSEMPERLILVSVIWPGVRPEMYRAAAGDWVREFEHDLLNLRFDRRRATRRAA